MRVLTNLWRTDRILTATGLALLLFAVPSAAGIWLDDRVITGAPAWLKPTKFALSTGIYALSLAWVFTWLPDWPRTRRTVGRTTAIVMLLEVAIIDLQAWRGTTSHFNISTPLDAVLFTVMGVGILLQSLSTVAVAVALWRQRFTDEAMGWALRLGMALTIVGALMGGLMTRPTSAQLDEMTRTKQPHIAGAHTVGAPDGGPGLPGTGWSTAHGDLRVPHFVGLHALQILPVVAFLVRRRPDALRIRLMLGAAAVYAATFMFLFVRALQGIPLIGV